MQARFFKAGETREVDKNVTQTIYSEMLQLQQSITFRPSKIPEINKEVIARLYEFLDKHDTSVSMGQSIITAELNVILKPYRYEIQLVKSIGDSIDYVNQSERLRLFYWHQSSQNFKQQLCNSWGVPFNSTTKQAPPTGHTIPIGWHLIHLAAVLGDLAFFRFLVEEKGQALDVNPYPAEGHVPLQLLTDTPLNLALIYQHVDIANYIIMRSNSGLHMQTMLNFNVLCVIRNAKMKRYILLRLVSNCGDNPINVNGDTIVHYAAKYNFSEIIDICQQAKVDLNRVNGDHETPLLTAIRYSSKDVKAKLLEYGVKLMLPYSPGKMSIDAANRKLFDAIMLHTPLLDRFLDVLDALVNGAEFWDTYKDANNAYLSYNGKTYWWICMAKNAPTFAELFVDLGFKPPVTFQEYSRLKSQFPNGIKIHVPLAADIQPKFDIFAKQLVLLKSTNTSLYRLNILHLTYQELQRCHHKTADTIVHFAVENNLLDLIESCGDAEVDMNKENKAKLSPIQMAINKNFKEMAVRIIVYGANLTLEMKGELVKNGIDLSEAYVQQVKMVKQAQNAVVNRMQHTLCYVEDIQDSNLEVRKVIPLMINEITQLKAQSADMRAFITEQAQCIMIQQQMLESMSIKLDTSSLPSTETSIVSNRQKTR